MFNMKENAGDDAYELRVVYNSHTNKYSLTCYVVYQKTPYQWEHDRDGKTLQFDTMEEVLDWITSYDSGNEKQLKLNFDKEGQ